MTGASPLALTVITRGDDVDGAGARLRGMLDATNRVVVDAIAAQPGAIGIIRMAAQLRSGAADVVLVDGRAAARAAVPAARLAGVRVVVGDHPRRQGDHDARIALRLSDGIVRLPESAHETADVVARLAVVAGRPGAGIAGGLSMSVVTTVRNEREAIDEVIDALLAQLDVDDELVVVDGGSSDGTVERIQARSLESTQIVLIEAGEVGISEGRNIGVRAARHTRVACTDAGCRPRPGWLAALRAAFADETEPELVTGIYVATASSALQEAFALACYPAIENARRAGPWTRMYGALFGRTFDPQLPTGRSMAFTKRGWELAGGFPEDLATAEDVEFGRALVAAGGMCVLAVDAAVEWDQRPDLSSTARMYFRYGVGDARSRDRRLVGRNILRALAYAIGPVGLIFGGRITRVLVAAGASAYLSVPVRRAVRDSARWRSWALLPLAMATKDLAKAAGCIGQMLDRPERDETR